MTYRIAGAVVGARMAGTDGISDMASIAFEFGGSRGTLLNAPGVFEFENSFTVTATGASLLTGMALTIDGARNGSPTPSETTFLEVIIGASDDPPLLVTADRPRHDAQRQRQRQRTARRPRLRVLDWDAQGEVEETAELLRPRRVKISFALEGREPPVEVVPPPATLAPPRPHASRRPISDRAAAGLRALAPEMT